MVLAVSNFDADAAFPCTFPVRVNPDARVIPALS